MANDCDVAPEVRSTRTVAELVMAAPTLLVGAVWARTGGTPVRDAATAAASRPIFNFDLISTPSPG